MIGQERDGVLAQFGSAPGHHTVLSADPFPIRATVLFLDSTRATAPERLTVLRMWTKTLQIPVDPDTMFTTEYLFQEDSLQFWLPVQTVLLPALRAELQRRDSVDLFVGYVGAQGQGTSVDWVFVVNEFQKR